VVTGQYRAGSHSCPCLTRRKGALMALKDLKAEIDGLKQDLGLSNDVLAGALKVDARTIERWRTGVSFPQHEGRARLDAFLTVRAHALDTFNTAEAARTWMHTNNRYLGGMTPENAAQAGRLDRVEAALTALDAGLFI